MPQTIYGVQLALAGVSIGKNVVRTGDHPNVYEVTLPAGKLVTAWVKTDANTAACNLPSGHGYTDGNFDVYFAAGVRYGVPGVITTNAIVLDGGAGTDFPATAAADVVVTKHVSINTAIDGDNAQIIGLSLELDDPTATTTGQCGFFDVGDASIEQVTLTANVPQIYDIAGGATNPFTGNPITYALATNGSSEASATLKIISLEDSTP